MSNEEVEETIKDEILDELKELDLVELLLDDDWRAGMEEEYDEEELITADENEEAQSITCPECGAEPGELHSCGIIEE